MVAPMQDVGVASEPPKLRPTTLTVPPADDGAFGVNTSVIVGASKVKSGRALPMTLETETETTRSLPHMSCGRGMQRHPTGSAWAYVYHADINPTRAECPFMSSRITQ